MNEKQKSEIEKFEKFFTEKAANLSNIRIRLLNKKMDGDRILKNENIIKKIITENKAKILIEILEKEENLQENQIQLYVFDRNISKKTYENKRNFIVNVENNKLSSEYFYNSLKEFCGKEIITMAKYAKYFYEWEIVPEMGSEGAFNLQKSNFKIKDGDWICIRNDDEVNSEKDDFGTEEDKKVIFSFLLFYLDVEFY